MKLTLKLTLAVVVGMAAVLSVNAFYRIRYEVDLFVDDMKRDAGVLGHVLAATVTQVYGSDGEAAARQLVVRANRNDSRLAIRWVSLDAAEGDALAPAVPSTQLGALAGGEEVVVKSGAKPGTLFTYVPLPSVRKGRAALELAESMSDVDRYVDARIANTAAVTTATGAVIVGIVVLLGAWLVGRPIHGLVEQARRVGVGDLSSRLHLRQKDEIGELALEMDAMCDRLAEAHDRVQSETAARLATLDQLRHADRLMTVGKLASGIAHELGTPLNVISGRAQMIALGEVGASELAANAQVIVDQSQRIAGIIRQLLDFARRRGASRSRLELGSVLRQTASLLGPMAEKRRAEIAVASDAELRADVDAGQLQQALTNLCVNGLQAMSHGGTLRLGLRRARVTPPPDVGGPEVEVACIDVIDQGAGIAPEVLPHIFEPFFTTKDVGEGTGLGLAVTYGIVREHGGWIDVSTELGRGTRFTVNLPFSEPT